MWFYCGVTERSQKLSLQAFSNKWDLSPTPGSPWTAHTRTPSGRSREFLAVILRLAGLRGSADPQNAGAAPPAPGWGWGAVHAPLPCAAAGKASNPAPEAGQAHEAPPRPTGRSAAHAQSLLVIDPAARPGVVSPGWGAGVVVVSRSSLPLPQPLVAGQAWERGLLRAPVLPIRGFPAVTEGRVSAARLGAGGGAGWFGREGFAGRGPSLRCIGKQALPDALPAFLPRALLTTHLLLRNLGCCC